MESAPTEIALPCRRHRTRTPILTDGRTQSVDSCWDTPPPSLVRTMSDGLPVGSTEKDLDGISASSLPKPQPTVSAEDESSIGLYNNKGTFPRKHCNHHLHHPLYIPILGICSIPCLVANNCCATTNQKSWASRELWQEERSSSFHGQRLYTVNAIQAFPNRCPED